MNYTDADFFTASPTRKYKKPVCKPVDGEWKKAMKESWWATNYTGKPVNEVEAEKMQKMYQLRDKLLAVGGEEACLPLTDVDYDAIMKNGSVMQYRVMTKKGERNKCHMNAAYFWYTNQNAIRICTGYALSEDGVWRQHSWLLHLYIGSGGRTKAHIVETTEKRLVYFGILLSTEECKKFYDGNALFPLYNIYKREAE